MNGTEFVKLYKLLKDRLIVEVCDFHYKDNNSCSGCSLNSEDKDCFENFVIQIDNVFKIKE